MSVYVPSCPGYDGTGCRFGNELTSEGEMDNELCHDCRMAFDAEAEAANADEYPDWDAGPLVPSDNDAA